MKKFKIGQALVFEPTWATKNEFEPGCPYDDYPIKYGQVVHFIAEHTPVEGHCIVVDYGGKIITMLHNMDFRPATEKEV